MSMAQRLKAVQQPVTLDVVDGLPHGFLSLVSPVNNSDMNVATKLCLDYIAKELHIEGAKN